MALWFSSHNFLPRVKSQALCERSIASAWQSFAGPSLSCQLDLILTIEYFIQGTFFLNLVSDSSAPLSDLAFALLTYFIALGWFADYVDCVLDEQEQQP